MADDGHKMMHSFDVADRRLAGDKGTFFVLENDPAAGPRWFCHLDGVVVPGLATLDEAIAWGVAHARTVIVRTLEKALYWAGARPLRWVESGTDLRPWPP